MRFCSYILAVDECWRNSINGNATCNNTRGSYMCACYPGYSGDGFNCTCKLLTSFPASIDNTEDLHSC